MHVAWRHRHEGQATLPETVMEVEYSPFIEEFSLGFGTMFHWHSGSLGLIQVIPITP